MLTKFRDAVMMLTDRYDSMYMLDEYARPITNTLVNISLYQNSTRELLVWVYELSAEIRCVNSINFWPLHHKLSRNGYADIVLGRFGDADVDIENALHLCRALNIDSPKYPQIELTDEVVTRAIHYIKDMMNYCLDLWTTRNTVDVLTIRNHVLHVIEHYFNLHCKRDGFVTS